MGVQHEDCSEMLITWVEYAGRYAGNTSLHFVEVSNTWGTEYLKERKETDTHGFRNAQGMAFF